MAPILEEYGPKIEYIEGPKNVVADTFYRMGCDLSEDKHIIADTLSNINRKEETQPIVGKSNGPCKAFASSTTETDECIENDTFYSFLEDPELVDLVELEVRELLDQYGFR